MFTFCQWKFAGSPVVDVFNGILGTWSQQQLSQGRECLAVASLIGRNMAFFAGGDDTNAGRLAHEPVHCPLFLSM